MAYNFKTAIKQLDFDRLSEYHTIDETTDNSQKIEIESNETISVYLRLRPIKSKNNCYVIEGNKLIAKIIESKELKESYTNKDLAEKHYSFSSILDETIDQHEIYDRCVRPVLTKSNERGATFLSYGTSSSGKTFTMLGEHRPGIIPRALMQIFTEHRNRIAEYPYAKVENDEIVLLSDSQISQELDMINKIKAENKKHLEKKKMLVMNVIQEEHNFEPLEELIEDQVFIWVSFVEIYNEKTTDLLACNDQTIRPLKVITLYYLFFVYLKFILNRSFQTAEIRT